jgi:tRNA(Ile)-lysidine synthase
LVGLARERRAQYVATGHTADDQAETVLHRLLRGTGLKGLVGIPVCRELAPGVNVIRPLLQVTRPKVLAYLAGLGQTFQIDQSNQDLCFTRNRIRHELLPLLANQYNPAILRILCRLAEQAEELNAVVENQARQLLTEIELPRTSSLLIFDRGRLAGKPRYLVREAFRLAWEREGWPMGEMSFEDWDRVAAVAGGEIGAADLPGRMRVRCLPRVVRIGPAS